MMFQRFVWKICKFEVFRPIIKCPRFGLGRPLSRGFMFLSTWSLLRRGAAKLRSIPIIFPMTLGGARGFRRGCMLFCHLFRLFDAFSRRKTSNTPLWDGRLHSKVVFPFHSPLNCGITVWVLCYIYPVSNSGRVCSCLVTVVEDGIFWGERCRLA